MTSANSSTSTAVPRFFNDALNSPYVLPVDAEEGKRLNDQHEAIKCSAGGKLVMAPLQLGPGDKVLDCGTGTGIWLLDLASECPSTVSLHGTDISPHLFPPPTSTPPNVTFSQHPILNPPPSYSSSFTLVNQRMLFAGLPAADWPAALRTHFEMLRPGGWVQLCELHLAGFSPQDAPRTARVRAMVYALLAARGLDGDCALRLAGWAHDAGFVNIGTLQTRAPVGARAGDGPHNFTKPHLGACLALTGPMRNHGIIASEEEYKQTVHDLEAEWEDIDNASCPFFWLWGQKPEVNA